nr:MAG TPA: hypothetical protein [Caudoviricetes sp.]
MVHGGNVQVTGRNGDQYDKQSREERCVWRLQYPNITVIDVETHHQDKSDDIPGSHSEHDTKCGNRCAVNDREHDSVLSGGVGSHYRASIFS